MITNESAIEISDRAIKGYLCHELSPDEIRFISDLKDMTFSHNMQQPKSMLIRKMLRRYCEATGEEIKDLEYKWLPSCLCVNN